MKLGTRMLLASCPVIAILGVATAAGAQSQPQGAVETLGSAKAVFERTCSQCHGLDRPLGKTFDKAGWETLVDRMKGNGAAFSAAEGAQIISYLLTKNTFEAKCSACHGTDRPLGKNKSAADWLATVQRMSGKKMGHLTAEEVAGIAAYLSLVRPLPQ